MNEFWWLFLKMGMITIPLTILLIINIVREILDFLLNRNELLELLIRADKLSLNDFEKETATFAEKIKTLRSNLNETEMAEPKINKDEKWHSSLYSLGIQREQKFRKIFNPLI